MLGDGDPEPRAVLQMTTRTLETLQKVSKHKVDEQQKVLAELNTLADNIRLHIQNLEEEAKGVDKNLPDDPNLYQMASRYAVRLRGDIKVMRESLTAMEKKIAVETDKLRDLFAEQKRYEILLEREMAKKAAERAKKQQDQLDEIGQRNSAK